MGTDITIVSLVAAAGVNQVSLSALPQSPPGQSCLSYMLAEKVEFFRSTSSSFGLSSKIGESATGIFIDSGLTTGVTYYYWARAVDPAGNVGAQYPAGAGATATPVSTNPGPNSVGTTELQNGAVTDAKVSNISGNKITANTITATQLSAGSVTAGKIAAGAVSATNIAAGAVTATKISVSQLSAMTANLGTITAGTITGITFTGGVFQTAASGRRIEITGSNNEVRAYDASGNFVGRFGGFGSSVAVLDATSFSTAAPAVRGYGVTSGSCHGGYFENTAGGGLLVVGATASSGGWAAFAARGAYGPFTGGHDGFVRKGHDLKPGDVIIDKRVMFRGDISNTVTEVEKSRKRGDKRVCGVVASVVPFEPDSMLAVLMPDRFGGVPMTARRMLAERYDRVTFNALGEGQMLVCGHAGNIEAGDYISAAKLPGCGELQQDSRSRSDERLRRCTIAQARENVTFAHRDEVKMIAVFYRCG